MKKFALVLSLTLCGAACAQTAVLKPGLWEMKIIHQIADGKDTALQIAALQARMQESLAKMSPEERKQAEMMMGGFPLTTHGAMRMCVSPAMAAKNVSWLDRGGACSSSKVKMSGNVTQFEVNCSHDGRTAVGGGTSTLTGNTISTHVDLTITDSKGAHKVTSDTDMTFVGTDCQGVVPMDQMAKKGMQAPHQ